MQNNCDDIQARKEYVLSDIRWRVNAGNLYPDYTVSACSGVLADTFIAALNRDDLDSITCSYIISDVPFKTGVKMNVDDVLLFWRLGKALRYVSNNLTKYEEKDNLIHDSLKIFNSNNSDADELLLYYMQPFIDKVN